jgi:hypothetical protein
MLIQGRNPIRKQHAGFMPAHKENKHEAGRAKKHAEAQVSKEAPCYKEVHSGEEIKRGARGGRLTCGITIMSNLMKRVGICDRWRAVKQAILYPARR